MAASEDPNSDVDREHEIQQTIKAAKGAIDLGEIPLICGDLNCGPEASKSNYDLILNSGFRDMFLEARSSAAAAGGGGGGAGGEIVNCFTWSPTNYLNTIGPHASCPGQRVDHLFLPEAALCPRAAGVACLSADIVFEETALSLPDGTPCTLSDHSGLVFLLRF